MNPTWKIWYELLDCNGRVYGAGIYYKEYIRKGFAERIAKRLYGDSRKFRYVVSQTNPWVARG